MQDVSALILAGGKATRFCGIAKHEIVVEGATIFERQTRVLAPRVAEIIVSSPRPIEGYRTVQDAVPGIGPLSGIAAGLAACRTEWLLVVAGDMPYITGELVDLLIAGRGADSRAEKGSDPISAVGVRVGGMPEPLVCLLRRAEMLAVVERRIAAGDYKASRLLTDELHVRWLELGEADRRALRNVNSPEDL